MRRNKTYTEQNRCGCCDEPNDNGFEICNLCDVGDNMIEQTENKPQTEIDPLALYVNPKTLLFENMSQKDRNEIKNIAHTIVKTGFVDIHSPYVKMWNIVYFKRGLEGTTAVVFGAIMPAYFLVSIT